MVQFDRVKYNQKKDEFLREYSRVEPYRATTAKGVPRKPRRELTKDLKLREEYKTDSINTYNALISFLHSITADEQVTLEDKIKYQTNAAEFKNKLKEIFETLNLQYEFDKFIFASIDIDKVIENTVDNLDNETDSDSSTGTILNKEQNKINNKNTENTTKMAPQTAKEFMTLATSTINYKYGGDPLGLDAFIDSIELLATLCEEQNTNTLIKFIKTRLEGTARESISAEPRNTDEIITQLRAAIKTASSDVIESKILALRVEKTNLTAFAERAEALAEQYRRSLCSEGIPAEKAKELSVKKTVQLCRLQARSSALKTIIASTHFTEPKDVVARMIVEIGNLKLEGQANSHTHKNGQNNNKFGKNFSNNRSSRSNVQSQNNNFKQNRNGNQSFQQQNNNNSNGNNRQNYNNGSNNRNGQNRNGQNRTYTNSNYRYSNEQPVRFVSGNSMSPGNGGESSNN